MWFSTFNLSDAFNCEKKIIVSVAVEGNDNSLLYFTVDKVFFLLLLL